MSTINSKQIVSTIIANDGYYGNDPRVTRITRYENSFNGAFAYGLDYRGENRYQASEFIKNPKVIWEANNFNMGREEPLRKTSEEDILTMFPGIMTIDLNSESSSSKSSPDFSNVDSGSSTISSGGGGDFSGGGSSDNY